MISLYRGTHDNQIVMGDNGSTPLWVAEDGSWGTSPITIFDAHHWTASDFEKLDCESDAEKINTAMAIADDILFHRDNDIKAFLDEIRERAIQLNVRIFHLTSDGMDELLPE